MYTEHPIVATKPLGISGLRSVYQSRQRSGNSVSDIGEGQSPMRGPTGEFLEASADLEGSCTAAPESPRDLFEAYNSVSDYDEDDAQPRTPRPSESRLALNEAQLSGSKKLATRADSFAVRFQSYGDKRLSALGSDHGPSDPASVELKQCDSPPTRRQSLSVSALEAQQRQLKSDLPTDLDPFAIELMNTDMIEKSSDDEGDDQGSPKQKLQQQRAPSLSGSTSVPSQSPSLSYMAWVPTNEWEVFKAEVAILAPIRTYISQYKCAELNTISTVHPKVSRAEYEAFKEAKEAEAARQRQTLQRASPQSPHLTATNITGLQYYACQTGTTHELGISPRRSSASTSAADGHQPDPFAFGNKFSPLTPHDAPLGGEVQQVASPILTPGGRRARTISMGPMNNIDVLDINKTATSPDNICFAAYSTPSAGKIPAKRGFGASGSGGEDQQSLSPFSGVEGHQRMDGFTSTEMTPALSFQRSPPNAGDLLSSSCVLSNSVVWPTVFSNPSVPVTPESTALSPGGGRQRSLSTSFSGISGMFARSRSESIAKGTSVPASNPSVSAASPLAPPPMTQSEALDPLCEDDYRIIVCVHGCYGGLGQWFPLWKDFAAHADVYAFDLPGFARSERPHVTFDGPKHKSSQVAIDWFHGYFDRWFDAMDFKRKVTVIGHSFGAYLFSLYAKKRPELFEHVFLADPWGVRPYDAKRDSEPLPRTVKALLWSFYNLQGGMTTIVKYAGPIGPKLIPLIRPQLGETWGKSHTDGNTIYSYIYQCNAQTPVGENGFRTCAVGPACPQQPLKDRLTEPDFPSGAFKMSFCFGQQSRFNNRDAHDTHEALLRGGTHSTYDVVPEAGHQIMSDNPIALARMVLHHMGLAPDLSRDEAALAQFVKDAVDECTKLSFKFT